MHGPEDARSFARIEEEVRRLWSARGLPPRDGVLGRGTGGMLRQFVGGYTPGDPPVLVAQRAVAADVDARATLLAGDRALGTLRREGWSRDAPDSVVSPLLDALGVWTGGAERRTFDDADRSAGVQRIAARLAAAGLLVTRDGTVRLCPSCAAPRSPERAIYHQELGDTFLVRFPLEREGDAPQVDALAWVDAPWRVLGATALLVSPELAYATVDYRRGDLRARLLTLRSSLDRLKSWLPGVELTVVEERPGRAYAGRRYEFPLRHEFPDGASLPSPSGTIQAVTEVGDSGTGVVPLVPGHGGSDAQIAERLGVVGWPLLTAHGALDLTLMHKYSGLDLETANAFVARDLTEGGSVLARLRVLRGVPYCGVCGRPLVWFPGRCWCLEPARFPAEILARYAQLLPEDRSIAQLDPTPWPVSETTASDAPEAVALSECERCSRLDGPEAAGRCPCGGLRRVVARRLVPSVAAAFAAWARNDPAGAGDSARLYVGERRRVPAIVHHLAAMAGVDGPPAEVRATVLPTVSDVDLVGLVAEHGADAVRSVFVRTDRSEGPGGTIVERCRQERRRLARLSDLAVRVAASLEPGEGAGTDRDLQPEDRALLARWGQAELQALAAYEEGRPAEAHRRLVRFLESDLPRYVDLVRPRTGSSSAPSLRRASNRTLATVVGALATALAPIAPFTAESVNRTLKPELRSLFETEPFDVERPTPDGSLAEAWDRWLAVIRALERFRLARRLAAGTVLPSAAVVVADDALGDKLRGDRALLERLGGVARLEVGSPRTPWEGRRRQLVPVESEIQRAYPALATQIVHLLRRMPPRRSAEADAGRGISVFVQGQPHQITPAMLAYVESLPERVQPTPFALGEMYVELPAGAGQAGSPATLALSADASWLVRRIARRLRVVGRDAARPLTVRVVAVDPLARELRDHWAAIAAELGVASLTIDAPTQGVPVAAAVTGRTRLGPRWSAEIPGLDRPPRRRARPVSKGIAGAARRMPIRQPAASAAEVDFANDAVIRREEAIRGLGEQLDQLLGAPLLGPAKVALAMNAGFSSVDEISHASFEQLATLPGFGRAVAAQLFTKVGRPVPPAAPRPRPPRDPPARAARDGEVPAAPTTAPPRSPPSLEPPETPPRVEVTAAGRTPVVAVPPVPVPVAPLAGQPSPTVSVGTVPVPPATPVPEPAARLPTPSPPPSAPAPAPKPPLEPAYVPESLRPAPQVEAPPPLTTGIDVQLSPTILPSLQPFLDATAAGHRGLAVVRENPERLRALVGPRPAAVYWLSNLVRDRTVRPGDLRAISALLRQGIEANGITAVFLEGIEYLAQIHGAVAVAGFLRDLDQLAREHDARAWVHLTPGLLSATDLATVLGEAPAPELPVAAEIAETAPAPDDGASEAGGETADDSPPPTEASDGAPAPGPAAEPAEPPAPSSSEEKEAGPPSEAPDGALAPAPAVEPTDPPAPLSSEEDEAPTAPPPVGEPDATVPPSPEEPDGAPAPAPPAEPKEPPAPSPPEENEAPPAPVGEPDATGSPPPEEPEGAPAPAPAVEPTEPPAPSSSEEDGAPPAPPPVVEPDATGPPPPEEPDGAPAPEAPVEPAESPAPSPSEEKEAPPAPPPGHEPDATGPPPS